MEGGGACRRVVRQAQQIREATGIYEDNRHVKRLRGQRLEVQSGGGGGGATDEEDDEDDVMKAFCGRRSRERLESSSWCR